MSVTVYTFETAGCRIEEQLPQLLGMLPPWRRAKALSYRQAIDRFCCAKAYLLLMEGLRRDFGLTDSVEFDLSPAGKPSVRGREDIHFSISHCRKCVCCAISDSPVGIDVEEIGYDKDVSLEAMNDSEHALIEASARKDIEQTRLWTAKEAVLKKEGKGITDGMKDVLEKYRQSDLHTTIDEAGGYIITTAQ